MAGPERSVLGREIEPVLRKFITGLPSRFEVARGPAVLEGVIVTLDRAACRATAIERLREREPAA
jgi:calcineurin-like phosphoesterase